MIASVDQVQGPRYRDRYPETQDSHHHRSKPGVAVTGVFDGHGTAGHIVSRLVAREVVDQLVDALDPAMGSDEVRRVVTRAFLDTARRHENDVRFRTSGTTAVVVVDLPTTLVVASVGDSQAFWTERSQSGDLRYRESTVLSPEMREEQQRISGLGSSVQPGMGGIMRVAGNLAVSRSFGDFTYSQSPQVKLPKIAVDGYSDVYTDYVISAVPIFDIVDKDQLANPHYVLASDGLTEARLTPEEILRTTTNDATQAASRLLDRARRDSTDDITVVVVRTPVLAATAETQYLNMHYLPTALPLEFVPAVLGDIQGSIASRRAERSPGAILTARDEGTYSWVDSFPLQLDRLAQWLESRTGVRPQSATYTATPLAEMRDDAIAMSSPSLYYTVVIDIGDTGLVVATDEDDLFGDLSLLPGGAILLYNLDTLSPEDRSRAVLELAVRTRDDGAVLPVEWRDRGGGVVRLLTFRAQRGPPP